MWLDVVLAKMINSCMHRNKFRLKIILLGKEIDSFKNC